MAKAKKTEAAAGPTATAEENAGSNSTGTLHHVCVSRSPLCSLYAKMLHFLA